jgi:hypothetical protein
MDQIWQNRDEMSFRDFGKRTIAGGRYNNYSSLKLFLYSASITTIQQNISSLPIHPAPDLHSFWQVLRTVLRLFVEELPFSVVSTRLAIVDKHRR